MVDCDILIHRYYIILTRCLSSCTYIFVNANSSKLFYLLLTRQQFMEMKPGHARCRLCFQTLMS